MQMLGNERKMNPKPSRWYALVASICPVWSNLDRRWVPNRSKKSTKYESSKLEFGKLCTNPHTPILDSTEPRVQYHQTTLLKDGTG